MNLLKGGASNATMFFHKQSLITMMLNAANMLANCADNPPRAVGSGSSLVQPRLCGAMNTKGYPRDSATAQAAAEQIY